MNLSIEKKGKTLHLLKASSKKISPKKKRKIYPILGTIQKYKKDIEEASSQV